MLVIYYLVYEVYGRQKQLKTSSLNYKYLVKLVIEVFEKYKITFIKSNKEFEYIF